MWLPVAVMDGLEAGSAAAGVETGAVAREAILRAHGGVLADVSAGRVKLRRRSGGVPVPQPGRIVSGSEERASVVQPAVVQSGGGKSLPASVPADPGVERALAFRRAALRARGS